MATKVIPLATGTVGCEGYTPVVYGWLNKTDLFAPMFVNPGFTGTFSFAALTPHGLVVQENIKPINGFVPLLFPQTGPTDIVVFAKGGSPADNGQVPYFFLNAFGAYTAHCPHAAPTPTAAPPSPPASPPPYVPPPAVELSITSIFLDAQPGAGLEELGRFSIGIGPATVETVEVRDVQGGFAGVTGSTGELRRYDEALGAYGPVLGSATVVDPFTVRITGIHAVFNTSQQFTFSIDLSTPVQLESARAFGTL